MGQRRKTQVHRLISKKMQMLKKTGIVLLLMAAMVSCDFDATKNKQVEKQSDQTVRSIQQDKSDLLAGTYKAICYSGFRSGQHPDRGEGAKNPSNEEILEDLQILTYNDNFGLIRLYDAGENSEAVLRIIQENQMDIKVMQGIWLKAELSAHETCEWLTEPIPQDELDANKLDNLEEIERGISLANEYPEIIVAVNVGNESLVEWNDHKVGTDTIISYVKRVQERIAQPVTVADNYEWWAKDGKELAEAVDFVCLHLYPVWEGKDIDEGMSFSIENIQKVKDSLPDAKFVIGEAGWASVATEFGERASEEKQLEYYNDLMAFAEKMNITTFFFEAFDEDWKGNPDNPMGAEKHWGIFTVDRKPKLVMKEFYQPAKSTR
jgi:exo-beta-1,3-glucanase (GH17 family)